MIGVSEADISPPVVMMAATLVRMAHPENDSLRNALTKAETRLFTHAWTVSGGVLKVESDTKPGHFWLTDGDHCECPTRKYVCWHRGAYFILSVLAAANIAPLKSASVPLVERGTAAAADDPAAMGDFLDRPEIAGVEDVPFDVDTSQEQLRHEMAFYDECMRVAAPVYARYYERWADDPRTKDTASHYAYGAAYQCALHHGASEEIAREVAAQCGIEYDPPPPPPAPGRRATLSDAEIEARRKRSERVQAAPVLWDTSHYSEEESPEKIDLHVKEPFTLQPAISGGPPDPFEDVL
jgi:hypothetical protein